MKETTIIIKLLIGIACLLLLACGCETTSDYKITLLSPGDVQFYFFCETYEVIDDSIAYVDSQGLEGYAILPDDWALVVDRRADD